MKPEPKPAPKSPFAALERALDVLPDIYDAPDIGSAHQAILNVFQRAGFESARLYYRDDHDDERLMLEYTLGKSIARRKGAPKDIKLPDKKSHPASHYVFSTNQPVLVQIDPEGPEGPQHDSKSAFPVYCTKTDPMSRFCAVPRARSFIDIPLFVEDGGKVVHFGKISLDHAKKASEASETDFTILRILQNPVARAISSCGWFAGRNMPSQLLSLPVGREWQNPIESLLGSIAENIVAKLNVAYCSIFLVHRSSAPAEMKIVQPEKLVLWRTTFPELRAQEKKGFYVKDQGLTGKVWASGASLFVPDLQKDKVWTKKGGHLNDSNVHRSFIGVPILGSKKVVDALIRVPQGHRALHPRDKEVLDSLGKELLAPLLRTNLRYAAASASRRLLDLFSDHLDTLLKPPASPTDCNDEDVCNPGENADTTGVWDFAIKACKECFPCKQKAFLVNQFHPDGTFTIKRLEGDLSHNPDYGEWRDFRGKTNTGSYQSLKHGDAILLTDLEEARKKKIYLPLITNGRTAMMCPFGSPHVGVIAVISSLYDLLRERDLRILQAIGRFCTTLSQVHQMVELEKHEVVELSAYQIKEPSKMFGFYARRLLEDTRKGRTPNETTLNKMLMWSDWLYYSTQRMLCNIDGMYQAAKHERVETSSFFDRLETDMKEWLAGANTKNLSIKFSRFASSATSGRFDEALVSIAALALFENAAKASPTQGQIHVTARVSQTHLTVEITDQGQGIPESFIRCLGKPGSHLDFEIGADYGKGAGCGIALVKHVIEKLHNGKLALTNRRNGFQSAITIPLNPRTSRVRRSKQP